jgi:hypothetical protein
MNGGQQGPPQYRGPAGVQGTNQGQQQPFSNVTKIYANWNACYSCGFDVADGHTSMSCPAHLRKATHDIYFNRARMLSSILIWVIRAPPGTGTRRSFPACDG